MFERILLPLDGSDLAEEVLPYGEELARKMGSEVILLHVCEKSHKLAHNMHRLYLEKTAELMQQRLKEDSAKDKAPPVRAVQLFGNFTRSTRDYATANDIGLVIMVAHGFTSLKAKIMGSIVDKVFRLLKCPSLLVQPGGAQRAGDKKELISRLLLPLDSSEHSEIALPVVEELAGKLKAHVSLFTMAKRAHLFTSKDDIIGDAGANDDRLDAAEQTRLRDYLEGIEKKLKRQGLSVSSQVTLGDDQAQAITQASQETNADLVVMATRGRSPITAWVPGSIAHKLLNKGNLPLLIVSQAAKK